jgi:hypothetical protein
LPSCPLRAARHAPDAEDGHHLEAEGGDGQHPGQRVCQQPANQPGSGELAERGGSQWQAGDQPGGEASLRGGGAGVGVEARGGFQRGRQAAQQADEVAARVALEQDGGGERVPGGAARATAQPLQRNRGRLTEREQRGGRAQLPAGGATQPGAAAAIAPRAE